MDMMDTTNEDNFSIVPVKRMEGKVGIPMICVSPSSGSTVTHRSAFPAVLLFEQIKNNIFLNQIRNYCSFFLSFLSW